MLRKALKSALMFGRVLWRRDAAPKVVFYHDVGTAYTPMGTGRATFWTHVSLLRNGDVVCFDDGFRGVWDERKVFRAHGLHPLVFLAVRLVGQSGYLTWDEVRTLQNDYGFEFQCHTWSHQTLAGEMINESPVEERSEAWYRRELLESKSELERQLCRPVSALCFPVGNFSEDVLRRCREAGYVQVYSSYPGNVTDEYIQPRCLVQDFSALGFKLALNGGMMAFRDRYLRMHWVRS